MSLNIDEQLHQNNKNNGSNMNTKEKKAYDAWENLSIDRLFGQNIEASDGPATFTAAVELMRKTLADTPGGDRYDIVAFPKEVHTALHFSVISVVRNNRIPLGVGAPNHKFLTVQNLLIEATGDSLKPYTSDDGNRSRSYTVTPSSEDVYNRPLVAYIQEQLRASYPDTSNVYQIDPIIVRRSFKFEDKTALKKLLVASQVAVETRAQTRAPEFVDFNYVSKLGSNNLVLPVSVELTGGQTQMDSQGLPVYSDAIVSVSIEQSNQRGQRTYVPNSKDISKKICEVGAMVELVNVDPRLLEETMPRNRRNNNFTPEVAWAPRIVITSIEQYLTRTPSGIFFAMASIAEMGQNRMWAQTFRRSKGERNSDNLRDIGYLNIEANLEQSDKRFGENIDTRQSVMDDRQLGQLLDSTVTQYPMFAVDCNTTGENAYYTTLLYLLARGDESARKAAGDELIRSLRSATDGLIDNYIDLSTNSILEDDGEMMHTGYWIDHDGKIRDKRELDNYLAVAARSGENNPETILNWADTWLRRDQSEASRMAERLVYLQAMADGGVVVTGTALRVTLNAELISAFGKALANGGLPLISRSGGEGDHFKSQRATMRARGGALYTGGGFGARSDRPAAGRYGNSYNATRV